MTYSAVDVIREARKRITDVDELVYPNEELISYLNQAIDFLNGFLIASNKAEMLKELTVGDGTAVPEDFSGKYAGYFPVREVGEVFKLQIGSTPVVIRYFANRPHVAETTDTVPFKAQYKSILVQLVSIYAPNRNGYIIDQDKALLKDLLDVMVSGQGG